MNLGNCPHCGHNSYSMRERRAGPEAKTICGSCNKEAFTNDWYSSKPVDTASFDSLERISPLTLDSIFVLPENTQVEELKTCYIDAENAPMEWLGYRLCNFAYIDSQKDAVDLVQNIQSDKLLIPTSPYKNKDVVNLCIYKGANKVKLPVTIIKSAVKTPLEKEGSCYFTFDVALYLYADIYAILPEVDSLFLEPQSNIERETSLCTSSEIDMFDVLESLGAGRPKFDVHWFRFLGKRKLELTTRTGKHIMLEPGDVYGVQEFSKSHDVIHFTHRKTKIKLPIPDSEKLMKKSKPFKGKVVINLDTKKKKIQIPSSDKEKQSRENNKTKSIKPTVKIEKINVKGKKVSINPTPTEEDDNDPTLDFRIVDVPDDLEVLDTDEIRDFMDSLSASTEEDSPEYVMGYEAFLDGQQFEPEENEDWKSGYRKAELDALNKSTSSSKKSPKV